MRVTRLAPSGLMGSQEYFRSFQGGDARILAEIHVITGKHAHAASLWRIEYGKSLSWGQILTDERMKLAMAVLIPVGKSDHISVIKLPVFRPLNETRADDHIVLTSERE